MSGNKDEPIRVVGEVVAFDPRPSIEAAARVLDELQAQYALIGGLALDAWGIARATKDADLAVPVGVAERAASRLAGADVVARPLSIGGVGLRGGAIRLDLIDRRFHFERLYGDAIHDAQRRRARVGGCELPLVSLEYLLAMKMVSGLPKDDADVRRLLRLEALDYHTARALVETHLGVASANRLDAFGREAGRPELPARRLYKNGDTFDEPSD